MPRLHCWKREWRDPHIAQVVEQLAASAKVMGSNPSRGIAVFHIFQALTIIRINQSYHYTYQLSNNVLYSEWVRMDMPLPL